jgi:hypothetical protein
MATSRLCGLVIVLAATSARAEPAQITTEPAKPPPAETPAPVAAEPLREPTAAELAGAPVPGTESGRTDPVDDGDSTLRWIGRGVLFVPKVVLNVALTPVRVSVWAYDRYQLDDLYRRVFFNDALTMGVVPTATYEIGFGFTAGARFVHRDLLGHREHLSIHAGYGGRYHAIVGGQLRTGELFGDRVAFELDAGYEKRPHDAFYGLGNGSEMAAPANPIDPLIDDTAVETRYRQQRFRGSILSDLRVWDGLHVRPNGTITEVDFGPGDTGTPIDTVYDPAMLVGFGGSKILYGELEVRWDSRHALTTFEPGATFSGGWLVGAFGGRAHRLDPGTDYWRYGVDAQHFLRVGAGPRVLVTRLHGEAVSGSRAEMPFNELPMLGGPTYLRGYALDRFRDRVAAFGSIEYQWDLSQLISASIFVDAGRVFPAVGDLSLAHLRAGYGIALEGHSPGTFLVQGSLASSIDGGVFATLSFNPVFDIDERVRRR